MRRPSTHTSSARAATRTRTARGAVTTVAAALVLTGCASLNGDGSGTDSPGGGAADPSAGPADPTTPLLQIEHKGGFVMMGYDFSSVPELTVYPDGRAINHGPIAASYPGPALPNLLTQDLGEDDVEALIAAARESGLLASFDYGQPPIADAPTTYVTLTVDGETYVHAAESLGVTNGAVQEMPGEGSGADSDYGLSKDQRAARAALAEFLAEANEIVGVTGEGEPYEFTAFAVQSSPAPDPAAEVLGDDIERRLLPWPLDVSLTDAQQCVVVDGDAAQTLVDTLAAADAITRYEQEGVAYDVWFRPMLPHEETCADVE